MKISQQAAGALAKLMQDQHATSAESFDETIRGVKVTFVVLNHSDQRDGDWDTLHCLGQYSSGMASLGTIPKEAESLVQEARAVFDHSDPLNQKGVIDR
jgi:hypothetical protein